MDSFIKFTRTDVTLVMIDKLSRKSQGIVKVKKHNMHVFWMPAEKGKIRVNANILLKKKTSLAQRNS